MLFLGRINWKKGLDRLIPAMAHVPGTDLLIAGNDEENYTPTLQALAERCGVAERVRFLGPVHGRDKWRLMATADVFALPSYSENFGIAALEAMACGVPVVVTPRWASPLPCARRAPGWSSRAMQTWLGMRLPS